MQLGFTVRWEIKKKSKHNSRDIFFAGRTAPLSFQSAKLLFKFWGPCTTQINSGSYIPIYGNPKCCFLLIFTDPIKLIVFFFLFLVLAKACGISGEGFTLSPGEVLEAASSLLSLLLFSCWRCREWDCSPPTLSVPSSPLGKENRCLIAATLWKLAHWKSASHQVRTWNCYEQESEHCGHLIMTGGLLQWSPKSSIWVTDYIKMI